MRNLNFTYNAGKDNEFQALVNINLEIYPEEFIIFFGPSGCGKSTLLNVIAGLEKPDIGSEVEVYGVDFTKITKKQFATFHRTQMGMIYQQYNLITSLTVLDNVALPQMFINTKKSEREKLGRELLERFGILKQAKKIPTELSGGQQQRIGIARAIVNNPKLVLADEPVGNLDSISAKNVLDILEVLSTKEKKLIILVTHNPEYLHYGDRILYLKDGVIIREVINRDKKHKKPEDKKKPKTPTDELDEIMRVYHGLTPEQINILIMPYKAKAFAHHFISTRNLEETRILEELIQRRLMGTISQEEFFDILHKPSVEGGVGFNKRTAEKIIRRVNQIIRTAYFIYQNPVQKKDMNGNVIEISDEERIDKLNLYLLKTCYKKYIDHLDEAQINRMKTAVKSRLKGEFKKDAFYEFLDKPFKDDGVGLNRKTARAITEEIELILILGFGIAQSVKAAEVEAAAQNNTNKQITGQSLGKENTGKKEDQEHPYGSVEMIDNEIHKERKKIEKAIKDNVQSDEPKRTSTLLTEAILAEQAKTEKNKE